jgi:hypothetical protein
VGHVCVKGSESWLREGEKELQALLVVFLVKFSLLELSIIKLLL